MEIKKYLLPINWNEEIFDDKLCMGCGSDIKVESIKAMKNRKYFYVYELIFKDKNRFFLCEECFKTLLHKGFKLLL